MTKWTASRGRIRALLGLVGIAMFLWLTASVGCYRQSAESPAPENQVAAAPAAETPSRRAETDRCAAAPSASGGGSKAAANRLGAAFSSLDPPAAPREIGRLGLRQPQGGALKLRPQDADFPLPYAEDLDEPVVGASQVPPLPQEAPAPRSVSVAIPLRDDAAPRMPCPPFPHDAHLINPFPNEPCPGSPWSPPGITCPWPRDEYVCDGGDDDVPVLVEPDWSVRGLDIEDTVVHFDTLNGRTLIEPSNKVCVYAPRFGAVRKVIGYIGHEQWESAGDVDKAQRLVSQEELIPVTDLEQPVQPVRAVGEKRVSVFLDPAAARVAVADQGLVEYADRFKAYENFQLIRFGTLDDLEKPWLAKHIDAAAAWTEKQAVQVVVDNTYAIEQSNTQQLGQTYQFIIPPGKHRLRVVKVASQKDARPGEIIEFTIRFDNQGDQPIGNVTVIDNLSPRLEFLDGTAQCSVEANFFAQPNEAGSQALRWEIIPPLKIGEGGVARFQCRVR